MKRNNIVYKWFYKLFLTNYSLFIVLYLAGTSSSFMSCRSQKKSLLSGKITFKTDWDIKDTTFKIFKTPGYSLNYKFARTTTSQENGKVYVFSLINKSTILTTDSLETFRATILFYDLNDDGTKDILIPYYSSARSNKSYHLYIIDNDKHLLRRVKGFEDITNPEFDQKNNIITGVSYSGTNYYTFYRINKQGQLTDLKNSFEDKGGEDGEVKYRNAIQSIINQDR